MVVSSSKFKNVKCDYYQFTGLEFPSVTCYLFSWKKKKTSLAGNVS